MHYILYQFNQLDLKEIVNAKITILMNKKYISIHLLS